jgi:hypothetical protein
MGISSQTTFEGFKIISPLFPKKTNLLMVCKCVLVIHLIDIHHCTQAPNDFGLFPISRANKITKH